MESNISDWTPVVDSQTYSRIGTFTQKEAQDSAPFKLAPNLNAKEKPGFNYIKDTKDYVFYTINEHGHNEFLLYFRNLKDLAWEGVNYELIIGNYEETLIEKLAAANRCGERNLMKSSSINILKRMVVLSVKVTFFNLTFDDHFRSLVELFARKLRGIQEIEFAGDSSITPEYAKMFSARPIQRLRFSSTQILNDKILSPFNARTLFIKSDNVDCHNLTTATLVRWSNNTPVEIEVLNKTQFRPKGISNLVNIFLMASIHISQRFTWSFLLSDNDSNTLINLLMDRNTLEFLGKQIMITNKNSLSCIYLTMESTVHNDVEVRSLNEPSLERSQIVRIPKNLMEPISSSPKGIVEVTAPGSRNKEYDQIPKTIESKVLETAELEQKLDTSKTEIDELDNDENIYQSIGELSVKCEVKEQTDESYWKKMVNFFCGDDHKQ